MLLFRLFVLGILSVVFDIRSVECFIQSVVHVTFLISCVFYSISCVFCSISCTCDFFWSVVFDIRSGVCFMQSVVHVNWAAAKRLMVDVCLPGCQETMMHVFRYLKPFIKFIKLIVLAVKFAIRFEIKWIVRWASSSTNVVFYLLDSFSPVFNFF